MEAITRNVCDIDLQDRQALEHVLGRPLGEDQQVVIQVVRPDTRPTVQASSDAVQPAPLAIPDWWNVYQGLSDEEVDRLDASIRQRAHLTRDFE